MNMKKLWKSLLFKTKIDYLTSETFLIYKIYFQLLLNYYFLFGLLIYIIYNTFMLLIKKY